eukprot:GHVH01010959.1.p1 GENE.GHVH01010959.1~~GHVH01010959.1.p1  ORF type:complete len:297 (+),score=24.44 GHVH01010959.1:184-1074(+)
MIYKLPQPVLLGGTCAQAVLSFSNGFISDHPFGCVNATIGLFLGGVAFALFLRKKVNETCVSWQCYSGLGYLSQALAMLMVSIYSKGSCEDLAEGCDDNYTSPWAVALFIINSIISFVFYFVLKKSEITMYPKRNRFSAVSTILIVLGVLAWLSGLCAIDGDSFNAAVGALCMLGGMSTSLVVIFKLRKRLMFPIVLAAEWVVSILILVLGLIKTDDTGDVYLREDALTTQIISIVNLFIGSILMFCSFFLKWEYQNSGKQGTTEFITLSHETSNDYDESDLSPLAAKKLIRTMSE